MTNTTKPPKGHVRDYMERRTLEEDPPPTPEEIRRLLGWHLLPHNGRVPEVHDD